MKRLQNGTICKVVECSGLDSNRIGKIVEYYQAIYWKIQGVYKPFDRKREYMLQDIQTGEYFTMFKDRLTIV